MFGHFFKTPWFSVLALGLVFFLGLAVLRIQPQKIVVEKKISNLQGRIAELEKGNRDLAQLLDYFRSPEYLEQEAKLKLKVKRPDEEVAFVYPELKTASVSQAIVVERKSFWQSLMGFFDW